MKQAPLLLHSLETRLDPWHSPRLDITLDLDGKQAIHIVLFMATLTSTDPALSPAYELFCFSLFHLQTLYLLKIMGS